MIFLFLLVLGWNGLKFVGMWYKIMSPLFLNNIIKVDTIMKVLILAIFYPLLLAITRAQTLYNHNSASYRNQTWMSTIDDGVPLRQLTIIGSHSSMSTGTWGDAFQTQASSLSVQLASGIRALDIRCRHYQNSFPIHQRLIYLNIDLGGVLSTVQTFLTAYPSQTVLMHIVEEYNPSGNSRTFQQTFISYKNTFSSLIWTPTTQDPSLGMTRGKVVIIQNFAGAIHGLLYGSFTSIGHKNYGTNWDQHDRWLNIKAFINGAAVAKSSRISFWTGSVGSFPYFCASGKSSPQNGAPRLATGLTTPGFSSYYPDFPRVACFIGICTIAFEGINILATNYLNNNNIAYWGIVFTDFAGDVLISTAISKNGALFGKCTPTQISQGCTACSTAGLCIACNTLLHYVFNAGTSSCVAEVGYYLNSTFVPELCSGVMPGCLECSSATTCTLCDTFLNYQLLLGQCQAANGYYLDANSVPIKCNIPGCYLCSSATVCTNCSSSTNFIMDVSGNCICDSALNFILSPSSSVCICTAGLYLNSSGMCEPIPLCPANNSGCLTCVSAVCTLCDGAAGFVSNSPYCVCGVGMYYDGIGCPICNATQPPCLQCLSDTLCTRCVGNFSLVQGQCTCMPQFYQFDMDTCLECTIGCLSCTGASACTVCDTNASFVLVGGVCECTAGKYVDLATYGQQCVPCGAMPGCLNCNMNGCLGCDAVLGFSLAGVECVCNFGYYVSPMAVCSQCTIEGCLDCDTETNCLICDNSSYYLDAGSGLCLQICGDGILYNLECDDGNLINGDGCSSTCRVETDFTCSGGSTMTPSACSYSGSVNLTLESYMKDENQNKVIIKMNFSPNIPLFTSIDYESSIVPNFPISSRSTVYDSTTGSITFTFTYDKPLNTNQNMTVSFEPPSQSLQFYYTPIKRLSLPYTTTNNLALKAYSPQVYSMLPTLNILGYVLLGLAFGGFFFGLIFSSKLMGVEMMLVLQVAFVGLMGLDKLEGLLYPLVRLWSVNGYNRIGLQDKMGSIVPARYTVLEYKTWFLPNFNVDFVLIVLPFVVGLAVYIYSKVKSDKEYRIKSFQICKEWGLSLLLFVQIHLLVSLCIGIKYGMEQIYGLVLGGLALLLLLAMGILFCCRPKNWGEYKSFFHDTHRFRSNFYLLIILIRCIIGISIAAFSDSIMGISVAIGAILLEIIVIAIFRPYKHNIRPIMNGIVIVGVLAIYVNYKYKIVDETEWITTYIPVFLLILLLVCVIINILLMIREKFCNPESFQKAKRDQYLESMQFQMNSEAKRTILQMNQSNVRMMSPHTNLKQSIDNPTMSLLKEVRLDISLLKGKDTERDMIKEYEAI